MECTDRRCFRAARPAAARTSHLQAGGGRRRRRSSEARTTNNQNPQTNNQQPTHNNPTKTNTQHLRTNAVPPTTPQTLPATKSKGTGGIHRPRTILKPNRQLPIPRMRDRQPPNRRNFPRLRSGSAPASTPEPHSHPPPRSEEPKNRMRRPSMESARAARILRKVVSPCLIICRQGSTRSNSRMDIRRSNIASMW